MCKCIYIYRGNIYIYMYGSILGLSKEDTRSSDYGSHGSALYDFRPETLTHVERSLLYALPTEYGPWDCGTL